MELIEIEDVRTLDGSTDFLAGASVEVPAADSHCGEWWMQISGWVVGGYEAVVSVDVVQQDVRVASTAVEIARSDVDDAHAGLPGAERAGFSMRLGGVWLPESFGRRVEA